MKPKTLDVPLMLASLALSFFLWVVVQIQLGAKAVTLHLPLNPINVSSKVKADVPDTVDVDTVLTSEQSDYLRDHKLSAEVDLKGMEKGGLYTLRVIYPKPPSDIVLQPRRRAVVVDIQPFETVTKDVRVVLKGQLTTDRLSWKGQAISPQFVRVSGLKNALSDATAVVEIDRSQYQDNMFFQQQVKFQDASGNEIEGLTADPAQVTVRPLVEPVKSVSLSVHFLGQPPAGYRVGIVEEMPVRVRGTKKALATLREVRLPNIDLTELTKTTRFSLTPILPEGVELVSGKTVEVVVPIEADPRSIPAAPGNGTAGDSGKAAGKENTIP